MSYRRICFHRARIVSLGMIAGLVFLHIGCSRNSGVETIQLDLTKKGPQQAGPWTYEYSVGLEGTRSEGYYGKLLYNGREVPEPAGFNDFYETPWGPLYWVGQPPMPFGDHGWMPRPMGRGPEGHVLMDPAELAGQVFTLKVEVLTSEELATPDRIETDPKVLTLLTPFDVKQAHIQRKWFTLDQTWESLHDTKRWGHLEVRVAVPDPNRPLAVEFRSTGDFIVTTSSQMGSLAALIPPEQLGNSKFIELPPQVGAVQVLKCTLTPVVGDALDLYLVCRVDESRKQR